ncbi:glucosylglycerate hydrolase [Pseudonocardia xishanensis]|uniref:Mannosylglycerate hydrolase MGH1-like glycoside hydrolase domain-containing protein n=1 Tax=Pseudonocardia xishanensis TaxID=630995 RepID=A0ABP8RFR3_9PSEU
MSTDSDHRSPLTPSTYGSALTDVRLGVQAADVLRMNDMGGWTKAAPLLYPHQWSWDSAFVAIGWAQVDVRRAMTEQQRLFEAQWANGMVPQIVFNPLAGPESYFPDPARWAVEVSPDAPVGVAETSGICQPPVHAIAVARIWEVARGTEAEEDVRRELRALFPKLMAWHRYLAEDRDPSGSGLVTTYHPWEGIDNSPRWDAVLERLEVGDLPPYVRRDLSHVADAGQRPSNLAYDRFLWLLELLKRHRYDDAAIHESYPFLVKDVFLTSVLVMANRALLAVADAVGATSEARDTVRRWIDRGRAGIAATVDPATGMTYDVDMGTGRPIEIATFAGMCTLLDAEAPAAQRARALQLFDSAEFAGHPALRWAMLPSTSPTEACFDPRNYWRGPVWPIVNWLYWKGLQEGGEVERAAQLREAALDSLRHVGFAEYFHPMTGEALGSAMQSWTAAVALDWLAA